MDFTVWFSDACIGVLVFGTLWEYVISVKVVKIEGYKFRILRWRAKEVLDQLDSLLCMLAMEDYKILKVDKPLPPKYGQLHYVIVKKKQYGSVENDHYNYLTFRYGSFRKITKIEAIINYCEVDQRWFSCSSYRISSKPIKKLIEILC